MLIVNILGVGWVNIFGGIDIRNAATHPSAARHTPSGAEPPDTALEEGKIQTAKDQFLLKLMAWG